MVRVRLFGTQAVAVVVLLVSFSGGRLRFPAYRVDLDVYRLGATVLLHGGALYGTLPATQDGQHLAFTYPPFAALLLTPFALLPYWAACVLMTLLTIGALAVVLRCVGPFRWQAGALLLAECLEPVRSALYAGQVDVLLMALVVLDVLVVAPRWPRGALVGVAAAVKLTPAVFVLYFLLRRDFRAAGRAGVSFAVCTGIGFLLARQDSVAYWTRFVFDDTRVGDPAYVANQSWLGVLTRLGVPDRTGLWLALVVVTIAVTVVGMRRAPDELALGLNAVCGLLITPISWTHHWVWIVVLLPALGRWLAAGGLVLFVASPHWWWHEPLVTGDYVWFGALVLGIAAVRQEVRPRVAVAAGPP